MLSFHKPFGFYHWLGVSWLLHCGLILPCVLIGLYTPSCQNHGKLVIELFGMVADRQQEARMEKVMPPPRKVPQLIPQMPKKASEAHETVAADMPVYEEKIDETPVPDPSPVVAVADEAVERQRQQSIAHENQDADKTREYLARLGKRLQANLVYPEEMRKKGMEGVSWISFTIMQSGEIREGSLRVHKSSGHAVFDSGALKTARVSAPFEKPPKELTISIGVSFDVMTARSQTASVKINQASAN